MKKLAYFLICLQTAIFSQGLFAQDATEAPKPADQSFWQMLIMIAIAVLFFYVMLWRPEQKRRKAAEEQRNALKKGDRVTAMGILGTVLRVQEQTVILKMYDGSKIEVLKAAINEVVPGNEEDAKKAEKEERNAPKKGEIGEE